MFDNWEWCVSSILFFYSTAKHLLVTYNASTSLYIQFWLMLSLTPIWSFHVGLLSRSSRIQIIWVLLFREDHTSLPVVTFQYIAWIEFQQNHTDSLEYRALNFVKCSFVILITRAIKLALDFRFWMIYYYSIYWILIQWINQSCNHFWIFKIIHIPLMLYLYEHLDCPGEGFSNLHAHWSNNATSFACWF